jgi:hypothetical protein
VFEEAGVGWLEVFAGKAEGRGFESHHPLPRNPLETAGFRMWIRARPS